MHRGLGLSRRLFCAFTDLHFRQLLCALMDTKPACIIKDRERNITCRKFCLRHIAQALLADCRTGSCSHRLWHISQHQTRQGSLQITMSYIPTTDGKTPLHMCAHRRLWRRTSLVESLVDLRTTWMGETGNGLTKTMRRHEENLSTSVQGAVPTPGTRTSARSAKAKGKGPKLHCLSSYPKTSLSS